MEEIGHESTLLSSLYLPVRTGLAPPIVSCAGRQNPPTHSTHPPTRPLTYPCILALPPRLFFVQVVEIRLSANRLAVVDVRITHLTIHVVFALQAFDVDFQVELAHPADDRFLFLNGDLIGR